MSHQHQRGPRAITKVIQAPREATTPGHQHRVPHDLEQAPLFASVVARGGYGRVVNVAWDAEAVSYMLVDGVPDAVSILVVG